MDTNVTMFLRKMVALGFLNKDNAPTQECVDSLPGDLNCPSEETLAKTVLLFHDETTFQLNDHERTQWRSNHAGSKVKGKWYNGFRFHIREGWIFETNR